MGQTDNDSLKLSNQLCFPLYAAARKVISLYTPHFKELGITYTQYLVFMALWENNPMTVRELCRILYLDSGTLTPLLKKLEREGYLIKSRDPDDERVVVVSLTDKGTDLREKVSHIPRSVSKCVPLSQDEAAALYMLLYKLLSEGEISDS